MDYQSALKYLKKTESKGSILGLSTIKKLLDYLGNPESKLSVIHITGTNGKGSVASYLAKGLSSAYSVGLFTSPYLHSPKEMIEINGSFISEASFSEGITEVASAVERMERSGYASPTEFETMVALGYWFFSVSNVDFAVVEVGLGGRDDATNVIEKPLLSIFSPISMDHTAILGNDLASIAEIKSGIIKKACPVLSAPQAPVVENILMLKAEENNSPFYSIKHACIKQASVFLDGQTFFLSNPFSFKDRLPFFQGHPVELSMAGYHQAVNASVALSALELLSYHHNLHFNTETLFSAFLSHKWPGRFEIIGSAPDIIIDGAHNTAAAKCLSETLKTYPVKGKSYLLLGLLGDKDVDGFLTSLLPLFDEVIVTKPLNNRAMDPHELGLRIENLGRRVSAVLTDIDEAVEYSMRLCETDDLLMIAGSLYMIGHAKEKVHECLNPSIE